MSVVKKESIFIGVLFIVAIFASIIGGSIIESVIAVDGYLEELSSNQSTLLVGIILELINGLAVFGIATLFYKYIKKFSEKLAIAYFGIRIIEAIACIFAAVITISLITLSKDYSIIDSANLGVIENVILGMRNDMISVVVPIFFSLSGLALYYVLYKTSYVPKFIPLWGFIGVVLIIMMNIIDIGEFQMVFALPIILNELFLGVWLILKGLKVSDKY